MVGTMNGTAMAIRVAGDEEGVSAHFGSGDIARACCCWLIDRGEHDPTANNHAAVRSTKAARSARRRLSTK